MSPKSTLGRVASSFRIAPVGSTGAAMPMGFVVLCALAFAASVAATVYFCRSMSGAMPMPGGWNMSMMWMRMNGQTWFGAGAEFLLMWLAMMVAMMLPSALPMFLSTKRAPGAMSVMAAGYFAVWLAAGAGLYVPGVILGAAAMRWDAFSCVVPTLSGAALIGAGIFQFTRWKSAGLHRCRSPFGCRVSCPERESSFGLGCKQGATCCFCCAGPMLVLLVLGMMNPLVIVGVAVLIAAEKILPRPELIARLVGLAAIVAGLLIATRILKV